MADIRPCIYPLFFLDNSKQTKKSRSWIKDKFKNAKKRTRISAHYAVLSPAFLRFYGIIGCFDKELTHMCQIARMRRGIIKIIFAYARSCIRRSSGSRGSPFLSRENQPFRPRLMKASRSTSHRNRRTDKIRSFRSLESA